MTGFPSKLSSLFLGVVLTSRTLLAWDYQGVCYDADWEDPSAWYGTTKATNQLRRLKKIGVNAISVTPFAYQKDVHQPAISFRPSLEPGLIADIKKAKELRLAVVLKPHIWSNQFWDGSGHWHGTIAMQNEKEWAAWFSQYEKMICHFAALAQQLEVDLFVIGVEYVKTTRGHAEQWRKVIRSIRHVYKGPLTYASHGLEEAEQLDFWEELDYVGLNTYFPITSNKRPTLAELKDAWKKHSAQIEDFVKRHGGKSLIITEAGYSSAEGTAMAPYRWPSRNDASDEEGQALSYEAFLSTVKEARWLKGLFIWKFKIGVTPPETSREPSEAYFVFQDKPAEKVIQKYFLSMTK